MQTLYSIITLLNFSSDQNPLDEDTLTASSGDSDNCDVTE